MEAGRTLIARAIARKCPVCGRGAIFRSHFRMNRSCSNCHVVFWKDPGESLGAMYLDYAVATGAFLVCWAILSFGTNLSDLAQMVILCTIAVAAVFVFFPFTRSAWTVLIYLSGGIERPRMRAIRGGKNS
ncbi:MAG TPA: DUF983 domain-containing protein [Candidatus Binataceae bacterium]